MRPARATTRSPPSPRPIGTGAGARVCEGPGEGDHPIAAIAEANRDVVVVTADRELAERVRAVNAEVVGPSWPLDQLVDWTRDRGHPLLLSSGLTTWNSTR